MPRPLNDQAGFEHSNRRDLLPRRHVASLEFIAGVALVISTMVVATVVSIGIARADVLGVASPSDPSFALAVLFGLVLAVWGWLTVMMTRDVP